MDGKPSGAFREVSGTGRVPHVRPSVRGPMKIFFQCFSCRPHRLWLHEREKMREDGLSHRLFRPMYPDFLHGAPPTYACAAFIKESRMKLANASKFDRKS